MTAPGTENLIDPLPGYTDPEYGREMARVRADAEAFLARVRAELAEHPHVVMRRCPQCGDVIGPVEGTRGQVYCSNRCADERRQCEQLQERAKSFGQWLEYRHRGTYSVG